MKRAFVVLLLVGIALAVMGYSDVQAAPPEKSGASEGLVTPARLVSAPSAQGCSGTPTIQYFYANPATIAPGQVTTLYWGLVGNANAAFLRTPGNQIGIGTPGTFQVNPTQTTTYFVIGVCGNNQVEWPITVTVQGQPSCSGTPIMNGFGANPTNIQQGQQSTLSWGQVLNADNVQLSSTTQGGSGVATPGSVQVSPQVTTTYFLTAWCQGVSVQIQTTINVTGAPPPPPANSNQITAMNRNGGLTNANQLVLTVNYFWNGEDAPAVMQGTAYNSGGGVVSNSSATRIEPNRDFFANLNFQGPSAEMTSVHVCMIGSSGTELVCSSGNP